MDVLRGDDIFENYRDLSDPALAVFRKSATNTISSGSTPTARFTTFSMDLRRQMTPVLRGMRPET